MRLPHARLGVEGTGGLRPTVGRVLGLDDIVQAHHYLEQGTQPGKIVVTV